MKTLIPIIVQELSAHRPVALATVIVSKGSSPRGAGACQLMLINGRTAGTVGGGVLERRAMDEMARMLQPLQADVTPEISAAFEASENWQAIPRLTSEIQDYALTQNDVQSLGMVCGGNVSLLYQVLLPRLLPLFQQLQTALQGTKSLWMIRHVTDGHVTGLGFTDGTAAFPTPLDTVPLASLSRKPIFTEPAAGLPGWFVEPVVLQSHAYLFGGGHVAQCVAPLLAQLDFSPVVYDDRPEFANPALFPTAAKVVCAPFTEAVQRLSVGAEDEFVIMTRGHANDLIILTQALRTPAYYIGLIGSRSKIAYTRNLILEAGFSAADFDRVHTPIGLPIQAETPMEIAVSVAAEMILCRARQAQT